MVRSAVAIWNGGPGAGEGSVTTSSGILNKSLYSFNSSSGDAPCTNPSEMMAAAVASCISLMVTQELARVGIRQQFVKTESRLTMEEKGKLWGVAGIELHVTTQLPAADAKKFQAAAARAKSKCPISRALKVPIKLTTHLQPAGSTEAA